MGHLDKIVLSLVLLLLFPQNRAYTQDVQDRTQILDSLFSEYAQHNIFNGVVLIAENNQILLKKGYGYANFSWKIKNEVDTKIYLASLSKHFTANCILQLYQEKKLTLEDNISLYLTAFKDSEVGGLSIHQLLSHVSGLKRDIFELAEESRISQIEGDVFTKLKNSKLLFEPGSDYSYSNAGYYLLAKVVEKITDKPFHEALKEMIFDPVGMTNTALYNKGIVVENMANGYELMLNERVNGILSDPSVDMGASGVYSTVEDIFKYELSYQENKILRKETQSLMETPVKKGYGYGWKSNLIKKDDSGNNLYLTFHNGDHGGFATQYLRYGPDKFTIIMLSNQDVLPRTELFNQIVTVVNGGSPSPIKKNKHNLIYETAIEKGIDAALKLARELKNNGTRYPNAYRVNFLGNMFLKVGRTKDAKTIHRLNIALHPKNFLGYAALGLILKSEGDLKGAKENFEEILKFDHDNAHAEKFLKELND